LSVRNNSVNNWNPWSFVCGYGGADSVYCMPDTVKTGAGTGSCTKDTLFAYPLLIPKKTTFLSIGAEVSTLGSSSDCRIGLYCCDSTGLPDELLLDAGKITTTSTGEKTIAISQELVGNFWSVIISGTAAVPTMRTGAAVPTPFIRSLGQVTFGASSVCCLSVASVSSYYTALPASLSGTSWTYSTTRRPVVFLKTT